MQQVQKMGSPDELAAMLPGVSARDMGDPEEDQKTPETHGSNYIQHDAARAAQAGNL